MSTVTIHSDFGAHEEEICHSFHFFSFYLPFCVCSITQSCLTAFWPHGLYLPGFSVHRISQARILECAAISYTRGIFWTQELDLDVSIPQLNDKLGRPSLTEEERLALRKGCTMGTCMRTCVPVWRGEGAFLAEEMGESQLKPKSQVHLLMGREGTP